MDNIAYQIEELESNLKKGEEESEKKESHLSVKTIRMGAQSTIVCVDHPRVHGKSGFYINVR